MDDTRRDIHNSDVPAVCVACEARHRGVCSGMKDDELLELSRSTQIKTIPAGTELFATDQVPDHYGNILSGVVKLSKLLEDGRQQIVGLQFAPDFIGRPFADQSSVTADAATDVTVCMFPRRALNDMVTRSPDLESALHRQALDELDEAREWMLTLGRRTAEERLAMFLYYIALHNNPYEPPGDDDPVAIDIPLTRADIADFLGLTIETVSRQFTKLRNTGVIAKLDGRKVRIERFAELRDLASS